MKIITIYQEGAEPIIVDDDDEQDLVSYIRQLSPMFEHTNISILNTKFTSVITRPSKIISIVVKEQEEQVVEEIVKEQVVEEKPVEEKIIKEKPVEEKPVETETKDIIKSKQHSKKKEPAEKDEYTLTDEE